MGMVLNQKILSSAPLFLTEQEAYSGVKKIADKVRKDIELVFGVEPEASSDYSMLGKYAVIYGTVGKSPVLENLEAQGILDFSEVKGKREVYLLQVIDCKLEGKSPLQGMEKVLIIAGSDKRGTIYGLFRLSELLGVSPFVDWCDVKPKKLEEYCFADDFRYLSKEPSVRFRGFFINDEWPAFGNWCTKNFGGFNAKAYEHVFELLLRMKGNYLWPAMWSARFEDDGPGLLNAELADELGVVMGMSHHEPCLRQGEEYRYLRGKDSIYGDAWNFRTNEAGITKFWEDGLKRSGKFENVITVGMRGEADTAIMGKNATMADNIELLRDVLKTQRRLIQENVNEDLTQVPRMIALYKEVEAFYYGNEEAKGLIGSPELEDIILMLCDDNFGNLRTLPTEEMRKHPGGYGMYYHFDYHGWPISFEWVNSSFLPKVWEQMTMAYDFGIRDLWIVNVGDICTQEFPLSYFLDLAYDFPAWGSTARNKTEEYTRTWIEKQFSGTFNKEDQNQIYQLLHGYTKLAVRRRPEAMNAEVYHPVNYGEAEDTIQTIDSLLAIAEELYKKTDEKHLPAYFSLVYYPAVANLNLQKMQLYAGKNKYFAQLGAMAANQYGVVVQECMARDKSLVEEYHTIDKGKFYGMGMSEHIGFINWNEDECRNPVIMNVLPADKPRILLMIDGTELKAEGSGWLRNTLPIEAFLEPDVTQASFTLYSITDLESSFKIQNNIPWLQISEEGGILDGRERAQKRITVTLDRNKLPKDAEPVVTGEFSVQLPAGTCKLIVPVLNIKDFGEPENTFIGTKGYISMEAEHYYRNIDKNQAGFQVINNYGKTLSGLKVFPTTKYFTPGEDAPFLEYRFILKDAGTYEAEVYMQPSNAVTVENCLDYGIQANEDAIDIISTIPKNEKVGDNGYFWREGVLNNIRCQSSEIKCLEGVNTLRLYAVTPGFVPEKIVIYPKGKKPANAYLGPKETYFIGREKL